MQESKFVSPEQELQFFCKRYGEMLGIEDLYKFYKKHIWCIDKAWQLKNTDRDKYIDSFKLGILYLEEGGDKYDCLLSIINKK